MAATLTLALALDPSARAGDGEQGRDRHHHHRHRPAAGTPLTLDDLGWPATTRSVRTRVAAKVYDVAKTSHGHRIGKIAEDQRLAWTEIVASRDRCKAYVAIEPRGWVCARDLAPSDDAPATEVLPHRARASTEFAGLDLTAWPEAVWPFAWAVEPQKKAKDGAATRAARPVDVRAAPARDAAVVRTLAPRAVVPVLDTEGDFARIGPDEWVAVRDLRIARRAARPDGVGADERWIDVDVDQQVLIAYDGDTPAYATIVSTGHHGGTPVGIYRIDRKDVQRTMRSPPDWVDGWDYKDVPFGLRFREHFWLHAAYWHDLFGNAVSIGCVNLATEDARWVFGFAEPAVPPGWLEARAADGKGSAVRIRDRRHPDPPWKDFDGKRLED